MNYLKSFLKFFVLMLTVSGFSLKIQAQVEKPLVRKQNSKIIIQNDVELRSEYNKKLIEFSRSKIYLAEENKVYDILKKLQAEIRDSGLQIQNFNLEEIESQHLIYAQPVKVKLNTNFDEITRFFDKIAGFQNLISIDDFSLRQFENQTADKTLSSEFVIKIYYVKNDSFTEQLPAKSETVEDIKEIENIINSLDEKIALIKSIRALQSSMSVILENVLERMSPLPGIFLESITQRGEKLIIKGNLPDESSINQFGRSFQFSSGLFSNINIESFRAKTSVNFVISCNFNSGKIPKM